MAQSKSLRLKRVREIGRNLDQGSFGMVVEVEYEKTRYACKIFKRISAEHSDEQHEKLSSKCEQLLALQHENVATLIGLYYRQHVPFPAVVMELVDAGATLGTFLAKHQNVLPYIKSNILLGVARGLSSLHDQKPPIVHGGLTAEKVLLTTTLQPKLIGMGLVQAFDQRPSGSGVSPEAMADPPTYSTKGDTFAFGNLILHTVTQECPILGEGNTEVDRRACYSEMMGKNHPLKDLATSCLQNDPDSRPPIANSIVVLQSLCDQVPYPNPLAMLKEMEEVKEKHNNSTWDGKELFQRQANEIKALKAEVSSLESEIAQIDDSNLVVRYKTPAPCKLEIKQVTDSHRLPLSLVVCPPVNLTFTGTLVKALKDPVLKAPWGLCIDSDVGRLYVATYNGDSGIAVYDGNCALLDTYIPFNGKQENGHAYYTYDVAVDASGNTFLVDCAYRVQKFNPEYKLIRAEGKKGSGRSEFIDPVAIAIHENGEIYICDKGNNRIQVFSSDLEYLRRFGSEGIGDYEFKLPCDIDFDNAGNIYVADSGNNCIKVFTSNEPNHKFLRRIGGEPSEFKQLAGICVGDNYIYATDEKLCKVLVFTLQGEFVMSFGQEGKSQGKFRQPKGIAIDTEGCVYVSDHGNNRIQAFK